MREVPTGLVNVAAAEDAGSTVFLNFYENIFSLILNFFVKTQKCDSHFLLKVILTKLLKKYIFTD